MRWTTLSDKFPDDWESKILRTIGTRIVLDNNEWQHINDHFWNSNKRIDFNYDQVEWLDESEPDQDMLVNELMGFVNANYFGVPESSELEEFILKNFTLIRK